MTTDSSSTVGAASRFADSAADSPAMVDSPATEWHTIDWYQAHRNVRRLQARIVKATQQGRWGKVKPCNIC